MEPEQIINLFDKIWFQNQIFQNNSRELILEPYPDEENHEIVSKTEFPKLPSIHIRSKSDQLSSVSSISDSLSPNSVLSSPQFHTSFSTKESKDETPTETEQRRMRRMEWSSSKSLTDLEYKELKGFMDLGFVFSEDDANSSLVEILPGLQRLGKKEVDIEKESMKHDEVFVPRPCLSEAWKGSEKRDDINPSINLEIGDLGSEFDVKQRLRFWAHSVASIVK